MIQSPYPTAHVAHEHLGCWVVGLGNANVAHTVDSVAVGFGQKATLHDDYLFALGMIVLGLIGLVVVGLFICNELRSIRDEIREWRTVAGKTRGK